MACMCACAGSQPSSPTASGIDPVLSTRCPDAACTHQCFLAAGWGGKDCKTLQKRPCTNQHREHGLEPMGAPENSSVPGWTASRCAGGAATSAEFKLLGIVLGDWKHGLMDGRQLAIKT